MPRPERLLLTGWFSFLHGEATAGDVLALRRVQALLESMGLPYDTAWSPGFPLGELQIEDAAAENYSCLLFICGPVHGRQITALHERFTGCLRIAVGVSLVAPEDPAARGFHHVLARDSPGSEPLPDLSLTAAARGELPVAGVVFTRGQAEYGGRRRHEEAAHRATGWLARRGCALLELDTRLARDDWRRPATPEQLSAVLRRTDVVVTNRLHGLVLALRAGVPALAIDSVDGGAKVTAQARALGWPAVVPVDGMSDESLDAWWNWCLGPGRSLAAAQRAGGQRLGGDPLVTALGETLRKSFASGAQDGEQRSFRSAQDGGAADRHLPGR